MATRLAIQYAYNLGSCMGYKHPVMFVNDQRVSQDKGGVAVQSARYRSLLHKLDHLGE